MAKAFDLITHVRCPQSGRVIEERHYRHLCTIGENGEAIKVFERPVESGIWYFENGVLDAVRSKAGLEKQAIAERDEKKTAAEKAKADFDNAKARYDQALREQLLEEKSRKPESTKDMR